MFRAIKQHVIWGKPGVGRSFKFGVGSLEEHNEHEEEQIEITRGNTQEQVQSHIH